MKTNKTMNKMRKQSKNLTNSLMKESMEMRKKSLENSKALIELDRKTQKVNKKSKKNQEPVKEQVQEIKVHPSFLALFWLSITFLAIKTIFGI